MNPGYYDFRHVYLDKDGEMVVDITTHYITDELDAIEIKKSLRQYVADSLDEEISLSYTPEYIY